MRGTLLLLATLAPACGCERFTVRTDNRVALAGPVETRILGPVDTRVELPPVSPTAGKVKPVTVQAGAGRVAVVDVDGLILNTPFSGPLSLGENPVALFREKLDAVEAEGCVRAVVLRVNSPGGGVAACNAMRRDLERFKARTNLPVVACLMDVSAGGAYHLASAADVVVAGPATVTGGLGVVLNLFNLRDLMAQFNIVPQGIKAGALADIGTSARALTEDEKALLQAMADDFHGRIKADVSRSRARADATVFDGRILTGAQAVDRGLVDRLGDLDDAIQLAAGFGCPPGGAAGKPEVVLYRRVNDPAHSVYAVSANVPLQGAGLLPNLPGLERSKLPTFLSVWQPELTLERLAGK
ncbi:MAG: S49 family peptidase [Isosphaera sp.]|nr:S49 family peptidase [Isosphaera sp.]